MQRRIFMSSAALAGASTAAMAASEPEAAAIEPCARDYIEGWYAGDAARMERSLHPELAKRIVRRLPDGRGELQNMGAMALVQHTRSRAGRPEAGRRAEVRILDVFGRTASVRVDADDWIDYMHLAQVEGRWRIVNVLWELRA
ncbi:nuclear transport factor 2 family protein [Roseateles sp.]|uniref:nuclear transport factor 2 family protein n=1 Tax=Roseateles sp. TaxID=1971397 RepID=UPI0039EC1085